jgi:YfiH family protein
MIPPSPPDAFSWVETTAGSALVCRPLAEVTVHLFTTRSWRLGSLVASTEDPAAWDEVAKAVDVTSGHLVRARQVHGFAVAVGRRAATADLPAADILVARDSELGLAVQVADCIPLLLADPRTGAIAAVHAGWRGLAARVPAVAVEALASHFGCRPGDLVAAVGPSIGPCCYEVGADVRERFGGAGFGADRLSEWFRDEPVSSRSNPALKETRARGGGWFLDMWAAVRAQLSDVGVRPDRTFVAELCTASHPAVFCSYRRDGVPAGRMAAVIRQASPAQG